MITARSLRHGTDPGATLGEVTSGQGQTTRRPSTDRLASGEELGDYRILKPMGRNALGTLHVARDRQGTQVLLRVMREDIDEGQRGRVAADLAALQRVESPFIARVVDQGQDGERAFVVFEDPGGVSLLDLVRRCRPLDEEELVWVARGLVKALATLHASDLPHGNVVPTSVAITPLGPVLTELGWAARLDPAAGPRAVSDIKDLEALGNLLVFATSGAKPPKDRAGWDLRKRIPWLGDDAAAQLMTLLGPADEIPFAKELAARFGVLATSMGLPLAAPLGSLYALLQKLPDRVRSQSSAGTASWSGSGSGSGVAGDVGLELEQGVITELRAGLELRCEKLLGKGGMGLVYLMHDMRLGRKAALKLIRGKKSTRVRRFLRETAVTARLDHPGIPPVFEAGLTANNVDYLLMRYVEGSELLALLPAPGKKRSEAEHRDLISAMIKVSEAVAYAHSRGIVHRDLKPENIMIGAFGEVFVMDWGLARDLHESAREDTAFRTELASSLEAAPSRGITQDGAFLGTPGYMPPEQLRGAEVDGRADIFAIGAILTEILTGEPPFHITEDSVEVLAQISRGALELPRERDKTISPELNAIVAKALAINPAARYRSAEALVADLSAYLEGRAVSAYEYRTTDQLRRVVSQNKVLFSALGTIIALLLGATLLVTRATTEAIAAREQSEQRKRAQDAEAVANQAKRRIEIEELVGRGQAALAQGQADLAREYFVKALALDPELLQAKLGVGQAHEQLAAQRAEDLVVRDADKSAGFVAKGTKALAKNDLPAARRAFVQALGFDGRNAEAREGLIGVDRKQRALLASRRERAARQRSVAAVARAREAWAEGQEQFRRQEDPQVVLEGYLTALEALDEALELTPEESEPQRLKVQVAQELYQILSEEGQLDLATFVLRFTQVDKPSAAGLELPSDPYVELVEAEREMIRRAFGGVVHFKGTRAFDGLRTFLRGHQGRFHVTVQVRSSISNTIPPSIEAIGLWVRLKDKKANTISPTIKIAFERGCVRSVRIDGSRRIVAPFDAAQPRELAPYVKEVETRVRELVEPAAERR